MRRKLTILILAVLLAACQAQPVPATLTPQPPAPGSTAGGPPTATAAATQAATAAQPPETSPAAPPAPGSTAGTNAPPIMPTSAFAPVSSADWSVGPDDATVTLIEYGDFQ